jgi:RNA polymerase sigma-70 factor, ECF subfamily
LDVAACAAEITLAGPPGQQRPRRPEVADGPEADGPEAGAPDTAVGPETGSRETAAGPEAADDTALLALARSGDPAALETLCGRNWRPVFRSFARYTADPAEAEDLTQEVFLRALRALPNFTDRGVPYTAYLLTIAANIARDRWRAGPSRAVPVGDVPDRTDPEPGPALRAVESEQRAALARALDSLAPDQRQVLRLRILEGRSSAEVAAITQRSPAAVRQLQVRALAALRTALNDQPGETLADFGRN